MKKKSLSRSLKNLDLENNLEDLEKAVRAFGKRCILDIKRVLRKNDKKAYSNMVFKKTMYSLEGIEDFIPRLDIYDKQNKLPICRIYPYDSNVDLNLDYKGKINSDSIKKVLENLGYLTKGYFFPRGKNKIRIFE